MYQGDRLPGQGNLQGNRSLGRPLGECDFTRPEENSQRGGPSGGPEAQRNQQYDFAKQGYSLHPSTQYDLVRMSSEIATAHSGSRRGLNENAFAQADVSTSSDAETAFPQPLGRQRQELVAHQIDASNSNPQGFQPLQGVNSTDPRVDPNRSPLAQRGYVRVQSPDLPERLGHVWDAPSSSKEALQALMNERNSTKPLLFNNVVELRTFREEVNGWRLYGRPFTDEERAKRAHSENLQKNRRNRDNRSKNRKERTILFNRSTSGKEVKEKYRNTDHGKDKIAQRNISDGIRDIYKRYNQSKGGIDRTKRFDDKIKIELDETGMTYRELREGAKIAGMKAPEYASALNDASKDFEALRSEVDDPIFEGNDAFEDQPPDSTEAPPHQPQKTPEREEQWWIEEEDGPWK